MAERHVGHHVLRGAIVSLDEGMVWVASPFFITEVFVCEIPLGCRRE